ncbi:MAG: HAD family hydrolase [Desulfocapsaceae bacterium]
MTTINALIFDMDGTLVDSERIHWQAWKETLAIHGIQIPDYEDFKKYVGVSDEHMAQEFSDAAEAELDPTRLVSGKCRAYLELVPEISLLPGVRQTLDRWRDRYPLAIASSSPLSELFAILGHHGLGDRFDQVVGGDMVARKKPNPEIYQMVVGLLGVPASTCIAFEDSQSGVAAAKSAGLVAVAVPHAMSADHDFSGADIILETLSDFDEGVLQKLSA